MDYKFTVLMSHQPPSREMEDVFVGLGKADSRDVEQRRRGILGNFMHM